MELEKNRNVVIDGNFYHMEQINDLLNKLDFPHEAFTLKADLSECIKRDGMRETPLGKKGIDDVFRLVSAFDYGNVIHTDGKTPGEVVEEIAAILGA
jgi:hypothetical protein